MCVVCLWCVCEGVCGVWVCGNVCSVCVCAVCVVCVWGVWCVCVVCGEVVGGGVGFVCGRWVRGV